MTRRRFFQLSAGSLALSLWVSYAQAQNPQTVQIGLMAGLFKDTQPALVQVLSKPLRDLVKKSTGLTGDVELVNDYTELSDKLKTDKVQLAVFHGYEFAWAKKSDDALLPVVVSVPPAKKFQASIIVRADCPHKTLADLKEDGVLIPRGTKGHCMMYYDTLRKDLAPTCAKPITKPSMTSEEAIDAVMSGEQTAALIDASSWLGYQNLQPGASKQVKMLCESEVFPQTVLAYRKGNLSEPTVDNLRKLLTEAHQNPAGKPLLMLWNLRGFELAPADYDAQLAQSLKIYPAPAPTAGTARTVGRNGSEK